MFVMATKAEVKDKAIGRITTTTTATVKATKLCAAKWRLPGTIVGVSPVVAL